MESLGVGLLGLGTVGGGVVRILNEAGDRLARRAGRRLEVVAVLVRDAEKKRDVPLDRSRLTSEADRVIDNPRVGVVVELIGGTTVALRLVKRALDAGKDVVTANKALLAEHGAELFEYARKRGRSIAFEASVGGGIPIVHAVGVSLAANQILRLAAIMNGTCNYILTKMTREGLAYEAALAQAQALGYAEADPTLDVDGTDTAHKLAVLAQLAFGASVTTDLIHREGIDRLRSDDIRYAGELGYTVKLLALANLVDGALDLRVAPTLVKNGSPLADVQGPYNAIRVFGDAVGDTLFYGRGAGSAPTASAVVGDLIDVAVGRAALTFRSLNLWSKDARNVPLAASGAIRRRYYLRFTIADRPGVIASLAHVLGLSGISIASVIQHEPPEDSPPESPVPLVIMTHLANERGIQDALAAIDKLDVVHEPSVRMGVEE